MAQEKTFEKKVRRWLESNGIYDAGTPDDKQPVPPVGWYFKTWGGGRQKNGLPDLIINVNGFFFGVELKAPNGKASDLQEKNIKMINAGNGIGLVLYPKGFENFKNIVKGAIGCDSHIPVLKQLISANSNTNCDTKGS